MKYIYFILAILTFSLIYSCKESEESNVSNEIADFEITGMVCKMGCGGAIRKELYASEFVDQVDIDFDEEAPSNKIAVHFNNSKISKEKIKEIIESINEGQFSAEFISSKLKKEITSSETSSAPGNMNEKTFKAEDKSFSFPNLTDLLNSLIH